MRYTMLALLAAAFLAPRPVHAEEDAEAKRERETRLCRQELARDQKGGAKGTKGNGKGNDWHERCAELLAPPPVPVPPVPVPIPIPVPPPGSGVSVPAPLPPSP